MIILRVGNTFEKIYVGTHWLTVNGVHASFDLRVDPERGPLSHGAQKESLKVKENLVVSLPVLRWLMGDDRHEVSISAPETFINCQLSI